MPLPFFLENGKKEEVNITIKWIYLPEITHFFFKKKRDIVKLCLPLGMCSSEPFKIRWDLLFHVIIYGSLKEKRKKK